MIFKNTELSETLAVPGSKSECIRALICAALCKEPTVIHSSRCADTDIAAAALLCLGAVVKKTRDGYRVQPNAVNPKEIRIIPDFGDCATALRLIYPIALLYNEDFRYEASDRLMERVKGTLPSYEEIVADETIVYADKTSQSLSGMLIAKSRAGGNIYVRDKIVSRQYVDLTVDMLRQFGSMVITTDSAYFVEPRRYLVSPGSFRVTPDFSGIAFLLVMALTGRKPEMILGIDCYNDRAIDRQITDILKKMGADLQTDEIFAAAFPSELHGIEIDASDCPDLVPPLCCAAALAEGETVFRGVSRLKMKESDRISALVNLLDSVGVRTSYSKGTLTVYGEGKRSLKSPESPVFTNDHRIAMAAVVLSQNCPDGLELDNTECINKSFPGFLNALKGFTSDD